METKNQKSQLLTILNGVEDAVLVGLLLLMLGMAVTQIVMRNFFESGIVWGDVLIRILVLWIGLAGAMAASRQNKHINIDVIARYLPGRMKNIANGIVELFTSTVCLIVAGYSFRFVQMEFESGGKAFAQIPSWVCESVIPFAFAVIGLRYFILSYISFRKGVRC